MGNKHSALVFLLSFGIALISQPLISRIIVHDVYANAPSSSTATVCNDAKPDCKPDLFQVDAGANFAKLYINPCKGNCGKVQMLYGRTESADEYNVEQVSPSKEGVFTTTINSLAPDTTYFFKIRCLNGCSGGDADTALSATTSDCVMSYYRSGKPQKGVCGTGGSETQSVASKTGTILGTTTSGGLVAAGNSYVWLTAMVGSAIIAFVVTLKTSSFSLGFRSRRKSLK